MTRSPTACTRRPGFPSRCRVCSTKTSRRWRRDNLYLRNAIDLPEKEILDAHARAKEELLAEVGTRTGLVLDPKVLTLGFARRVATYKRATLLFTDPERLVQIAKQAGGLQIIFAGKAHPQDEPGKALIQKVVEDAQKFSNTQLKVVYLENYEWNLGATADGRRGCVGEYAHGGRMRPRAPAA